MNIHDVDYRELHKYIVTQALNADVVLRPSVMIQERTSPYIQDPIDQIPNPLLLISPSCFIPIHISPFLSS